MSRDDPRVRRVGAADRPVRHDRWSLVICSAEQAGCVQGLPEQLGVCSFLSFGAVSRSLRMLTES